jgi:hypothetical protein
VEEEEEEEGRGGEEEQRRGHVLKSSCVRTDPEAVSLILAVSLSQNSTKFLTKE